MVSTACEFLAYIHFIYFLYLQSVVMCLLSGSIFLCFGLFDVFLYTLTTVPFGVLLYIKSIHYDTELVRKYREVI